MAAHDNVNRLITDTVKIQERRRREEAEGDGGWCILESPRFEAEPPVDHDADNGRK